MEKIELNNSAVIEAIQNSLDKTTLGANLAPYIPATKDGIWICYIDGNNNRILVPWGEWDSGRTDGVGVAVIAGGRRLLIAPNEETLYWSSAAGIGGAVLTTSKESADQDYAGMSNTAAIVASSAFSGDGAGYAPGYCHAYSKGNMAAGSWWLPSLGELGMIYSRYNEINTALGKIGGSPLVRSSYWSSTEYSSTGAWFLHFSNGLRGGSTKATNQYHVRPVSAF